MTTFYDEFVVDGEEVFVADNGYYYVDGECVAEFAVISFVVVLLQLILTEMMMIQFSFV